MIEPLSISVARDLRGRGYPYPVSYGPERAERTGFHPGIVFERDRTRAEAVLPPVNAKFNPEAPFTRRCAGAFTVYAASTQPGAIVSDHEAECDRVCDGVISAMYRVVTERRLLLHMLAWQVLPAKLFHDSEAWSGCAARVTFDVQVLIRDVTYADAGGLVGTITEFAKPVISDPPLPDFDVGAV